MANRYDDRVEAIVAYLQAYLGTTNYFVTKSVSLATATGAAKRAVVVRWTGMVNDEERGVTQPSADNQAFICVGIPVACQDDIASEECDQIAADITDAIRATRSQKVLGGVSLGWKVERVNKGPTQSGQMAVEIAVAALVEEAAPSAFVWEQMLAGYNFGSIAKNAAPTVMLIHLNNPNSATITISSVTTPAKFTASAVPATLASGATGNITLTFTGSDTIGTYSGNVTIVTNVGTILYPVLATVV
jgi:hypothetical protein